MDRKTLKVSGKNLFKKNYWHSVLIAFLMVLTLSEGGGGISLTTSSDTSDLSNFNFSSFDFSMSQNFFFEPPVLIGVGIGAVIVVILSYFVFNSLRCGGIRYFLKSRKNQPVELKEAVENLKDKTFLNIAKVTFFRDLSLVLWTMLFFVPGVIKACEYAAINYILAVRPDIDRKEAHRLSKILMNGNKWDFFVLQLSFLGWRLLSSLTFGILYYLYVNPYEQATYVEFFSDLRLQALAKGKITLNDIPDYNYYNSEPQYQPPIAQQENNFYPFQYSPVENGLYVPQQPINQPVIQPTEQPIEPFAKEPVVEEIASEPVIEQLESVEEASTEE